MAVSILPFDGFVFLDFIALDGVEITSPGACSFTIELLIDFRGTFSNTDSFSNFSLRSEINIRIANMVNTTKAPIGVRWEIGLKVML